MSVWIRRLGWRVCTANGITNLRRSPRAKGGKGRQETVCSPKGTREKKSEAEHTKRRNRNGKKAKTKENTTSND